MPLPVWVLRTQLSGNELVDVLGSEFPSPFVAAELARQVRERFGSNQVQFFAHGPEYGPGEYGPGIEVAAILVGTTVGAAPGDVFWAGF